MNTTKLWILAAMFISLFLVVACGGNGQPDPDDTDGDSEVTDGDNDGETEDTEVDGDTTDTDDDTAEAYEYNTDPGKTVVVGEYEWQVSGTALHAYGLNEAERYCGKLDGGGWHVPAFPTYQDIIQNCDSIRDCNLDRYGEGTILKRITNQEFGPCDQDSCWTNDFDTLGPEYYYWTYDAYPNIGIPNIPDWSAWGVVILYQDGCKMDWAFQDAANGHPNGKPAVRCARVILQ